MALVLTTLKDIPLIQPGDSIASEIIRSVSSMGFSLESSDILVVAQKIVSKSEGRFVNLSQIIPSEKARQLAIKTEKDPRFIELVLRESKAVLRTRIGTIIVEHRQGFICANAGIDHSNVQGFWGKKEDWVLLLPEDSDRSAAKIRLDLEAVSHLNLGVLIIDSHGRAWRNGIVGICIGLSGLPALVDLRGQEDMFGYQLKVTQVAAADELAAAASLMIGQAGGMTPVVHVRGFPYQLRDSTLKELIRPEELDLFR